MGTSKIIPNEDNDNLLQVLHDVEVYEPTPKTWHQERLANHKAGDRLPRGRKFDPYRKHLENKSSAKNLGSSILGSIKFALSQALGHK